MNHHFVGLGCGLKNVLSMETGQPPLLTANEEVDIVELLSEEELLNVIDEGALGEFRRRTGCSRVLHSDWNGD